jgi:hypothetical protein
LDSWYFGMSIFVLLVPAILLGKRFYVTWKAKNRFGIFNSTSSPYAVEYIL